MIKNFLILLLFSSATLLAEEETTCYSVQLASYLQKNERYINATHYPQSCNLLTFGNVKAIRCGCYDTFSQAKEKSTLLKKKYTRALIVRTNRSRFSAPKTISKKDTNTTVHKKPNPTTTVFNQATVISKKDTTKKTKTGFSPLAQENLPAEESEYQGYEDIPTKLKIQYFFYESELAIQGHIDLTSQAYISRPDKKHKANLTGSGDIEFDFTKDDFEAIAQVYAQVDTHDIPESSGDTSRTFVRIDELYAKYNFEDDQISAGKTILFWGALEANNLADTFNNDDFRSDPFNADKIGSWNVSYTHYTETGELSAIIKLYEEDRKMAYFPYVYNFFPEYAIYNENLHTEESPARPSIFLNLSGSTDTQYPLDYALIFENGYDSQRYYTTNAPVNSIPVGFQENAYLVNKLITYNTLVVDSTLIKLEAIYADIIDDKVISDYYHLGLGVEHTLPQFNEEADLGLIAEYYKYDTFDKDKYDDLDLFEVFQNDLFLGGRYSFNQGNDASIIAGIVWDLDYREQAYSFEYETRLAEIFKLSFDYYYIEPSEDTQTAYNLLGRHQRLSLQLGYYF